MTDTLSRASTDALASTHPVLGGAAGLAIGYQPRPVRWGRWVAAAALLPVLALVAVVGGAATTNPSCGAQIVTVFDGDLARVLATIRTVESGNNYQAQARGSTASGAYQFLDSSWGNYAGYSRAWLAPAHVQDAKAAEWATVILQRHAGDVSTVPVTWYIGHLPAAGSAEWDLVPYPGAGNVLTPRQYQAKWMGVFNNLAAPDVAGGSAVPEGPSCVGVVGSGNYAIPATVTQLVASQISWGGFANGQIPLTAMRYSRASGYLHPAASAAWEQLYAAALTEGFDLRGSGYRPASAGGATAGRSNHGWGLAIDVAVLVPGNRYRNVDAAFASPEYEWLVANAARWGWINPVWAKPVTLGGTGAGGHVGDQCCFLEPWHWEWAAFMNRTTPAASETP